jgi:hypothetical protein
MGLATLARGVSTPPTLPLTTPLVLAAIQGLALLHFSTQRKRFSWDIFGGSGGKNGSG